MEKWHVYLQEARTQVEFAKRSYSAFQTAEAQAAVVEAFFHLNHFVVHATTIDRILDAKPGMERHKIVSGHVDLSGIDLKPFRRLRNHLEHFDERLDRWVREHDGHALFDMNIMSMKSASRTVQRPTPNQASRRSQPGAACRIFSCRFWQ